MTVASTPLLHCSSDDVGDYLYNLPPFLPAKEVRYAFGTVAITVILLSLTRMAMMRCCCCVVTAASSRKNHDTQQPGQRTKRAADRHSLQIMYLMANTGLAAWGIAALLPMIRSGVWHNNKSSFTSSALARAEGHIALGAFGSAQAGYSLWSIVADPKKNAYIFRRNNTTKLGEDSSTMMLVHHCVTVLASILLATCHLGFRVYAPFFCGIVELSSVPLVIMKGLAKRSTKTGYYMSRVVFAVTFVLVRIVAWLAFVRLFVIDIRNVLSLSGTKKGIAILIPCGAMLPMLLLTLLQFYWGLVIVKGVLQKSHRLDSSSSS